MSRPLVCHGIDDYTNTVSILSNVAHQVDQIEEPTTFENALSGEYSKEWKAAADLEYSALMDNQTWSLVELPEGKNVVGCKWVFRVKYDGKGEVNRFKGRLVAQGFSQRHTLIMKKCSHLLLILVFCWHSQLRISSKSIRWMSLVLS